MTLALFLACSGSISEERSRECAIDEGDFEAWVPADRSSPLPVVMYIHGYNGSPSQVSGDEVAMAAFADAGILLLIPDSPNGSWDVRLSSSTRDDLGFFDAILGAAESCWGIDESRVYATGFSIGGTMAHQLACHRGEVFSASAPISGTFWEPMPESCAAPPIPIRHTHGLADNTWPYEGQQFSPQAVQGAVEDGIAFWLTHNSAPDETTTETDGELTCTIWAGEAEVQLCTHDAGHTRLAGWAERMIAWFNNVR